MSKSVDFDLNDNIPDDDDKQSSGDDIIDEDAILNEQMLPAAIDEKISIVKTNGSGVMLNDAKQLQMATERYEMMHDFCVRHIKKQNVLNYNGVPYIKESGLNKFRAVFGIYEKDKSVKIIYKDGSSKNILDSNSMRGEWDYILVNGTVGSVALGIEAPVFGAIQIKSMNNKNIDNDKTFHLKKAYANFSRRGINKILGIDGLDWTDFNDINAKDCASVVSGKGETGGNGDNPLMKKGDANKAMKAWNDLLKLNDGDEDMAKDMCINLTGFTDKKTGAWINGKHHPSLLNETPLGILIGKIDKLMVEFNNKNKNDDFDYPNSDEKNQLLQEIGEYYTNERAIFDKVTKKHKYTTEMLKTKLGLNQLKELLTEIKEAVQN